MTTNNMVTPYWLASHSVGHSIMALSLTCYLTPQDNLLEDRGFQFAEMEKHQHLLQGYTLFSLI